MPQRLIAWLRRDLARVRVADREIAVKRVHLTTVLLAAAVALIVGFAGGLFAGAELWRPSAKQIAQACPSNNAQMGCVVKLYAQHQGVKAHDPAGPFFPDVYEGQGHPDWAAAKPHISGAIVKAFEFRQDNSFVYNASSLTRLGIRWGAYLFVRGCGYGPAFAQTVRPWIAHISVLVLDMEVPAAGGCAPALYASVHAAFPTVRIVIYSAPGTWPGGSSRGLDVWVASYGPSAPPCLFTCSVGAKHGQTILAWQLTDGTFGFRIFTPGIGFGDDSVDYGIFNVPTPPKPDTYAALLRTYVALYGVRMREWNTRVTWDHEHCERPVRRAVCRYTRQHLIWLRDRLWTVAHEGHVCVSVSTCAPIDWTYPKGHPRGRRLQLLEKPIGSWTAKQ